MPKRASALATPNIAVVKYWGKRDEDLILPCNSSLSFTMDETLKTITEVEFAPGISETTLVLDGKKITGKEFEGVRKVFSCLRQKYGISENAKITSKNYFPTAAGMASSASGYAALAVAINGALELGLSGRDLSILARLGSGSACRSVYGGFVEWKKGEMQDGSDSFAVQIADESHWPALRNVIAIVDAEKKKVSSRAGMRETVKTSGLFKERMKGMDKTVRDMKAAVMQRDFESFANLTMQDSDSMHAVMADTKPPIVYLNETSRRIIAEVGKLNRNAKAPICTYTFDAGPNAHIYTLERNVRDVEKMLSGIAGINRTLVCKVGSGPRIIG